MKSCKEPCKECPWRKKSAKGWLGGQEPEVFTDIVRSGNFLPCHLTHKEDLSFEEMTGNKKINHCTGALIAMNNSLMQSRNEDIVKLQEQHGKDERVFNRLSDFEKYHSSPNYSIEEFLESKEWNEFVNDSGDDKEAESLYKRVYPKPKCKGCGDSLDELSSYYEAYHNGIFSGNGFCIYCTEDNEE